MRSCTFSFRLLSSLIALSRSEAIEQLCAMTLSRCASAFCFSKASSFVCFSTSLMTVGLNAFLRRSYSCASSLYSISRVAVLPIPTRLPTLSKIPSTMFLRIASRFFCLSAISLSSAALRSDLALFSTSMELRSASAFALAVTAFSFSALACSASCFCLAMMKSVLSKCFLPVRSFDIPLSISKHSAKSVCISPMHFSSSLQDFPVSWFIQSHTIWA